MTIIILMNIRPVGAHLLPSMDGQTEKNVEVKINISLSCEPAIKKLISILSVDLELAFRALFD
jgi:hypothetical protein